MSAKTSASIFIDDAENIDPNTLNLSSKRKRSLEDDDVIKGSPKSLKSSRFALTTRDHNMSPHLSTPLKIAPSTPRSAPILKPAGRSPQLKSIKTSARRSIATKARPELGSKRGVARPFSLATALAQTKTSSSAPKPKAPASWFFDIHVDSEEEEMTNLMQHSTGVLDISDDESNKSSAAEGRGKENVPPAELGIDLLPSDQVTALAAAAAARKASRMEEDRTPLGELHASDFYPEDCNTFSYAVVYDDENENVGDKKSNDSEWSGQATVSPTITASVDSSLETVIPPKPAVDNTDKSESDDAKVDGATEEATQITEV